MTSLYELTNSWDKPARQRFVENFTGDALDTSIWGFGGSSGGTANSVTMNDAIDGGVELIAGSSGWNYVWLSTGISGTNDNDGRGNAALDIKRYNPYGSSVISVVKCTGGTSPLDDCGFGFSTEGSGYCNRPNMVSMLIPYASTYFKFRSHPASGSSTTTTSDFTIDTAYHMHKVDLNTTSDQLTIDGVLKITHSGKQVVVPMDVNLCAASNNNFTTTLNFNYVEAWNH